MQGLPDLRIGTLLLSRSRFKPRICVLAAIGRVQTLKLDRELLHHLRSSLERFDAHIGRWNGSPGIVCLIEEMMLQHLPSNEADLHAVIHH